MVIFFHNRQANIEHGDLNMFRCKLHLNSGGHTGGFCKDIDNICVSAVERKCDITIIYSIISRKFYLIQLWIRLVCR